VAKTVAAIGEARGGDNLFASSNPCRQRKRGSGFGGLFEGVTDGSYPGVEDRLRRPDGGDPPVLSVRDLIRSALVV
jgi:hypothetical protein